MAPDLVYRVLIRVALPVMRLMRWDVDVEGVDRIPRTGGAVLAANHVSMIDFVFIAYAAHLRGRFVRFMALKAAFDHAVGGWLLRRMHHIPVDRELAPTQAFAPARDALRSGELVGIHIEGKVNPEFTPSSVKSGAARLAMTAGVPLLPVAVWGGQQLWAKGRPTPWRRGVRIRVVVGDPVSVAADDRPRQVTMRLASGIGSLLERAVGDAGVTPTATA